MSAATLTALIARCRSLCRPRLQMDDAELLRRFAHHREAAAFEELLERYAPLVWGVCRRMLSCEADCEDAFQATFLALVRKPGSIDPSQALGGWLHTVAVRVIRKAQVRAQRQRPQALLPERGTAGDVADEVGSRELFRVVDEEIERLSSLLRLPLILCCLQGRTRDEAAAALGCSVAAVKSRLERGRELLRRRLQQRGLSLPAAFLVLGLTSQRIRAALWAKTMQSVLYTPAPAIVALADAGVSAMTMGKGKLLLVALLLVSSAAGAAGTLLREKPAETPVSPQAKAVTAEKKAEAPRIRTDGYGDPLPDGAIARLGTVRWRHGFLMHALAYSPDGKAIAAVGCGRTLTLWDAATGKERSQFPNLHQPHALAFSPDGKMIATTDNRFCSLWDAATGKEVRRLKGHSGVRSVAFSPDGKLVATGGFDETVRLWDSASGKEQRRMGAAGTVRHLAYSPNGKWIASASIDGTIQLWDPATGKEQRRLSGHKKAICSIVFSRDGKRLATSSNDGTMRLWDAAAGWQSRILAEELGEERPIAFSPDGAMLALGHQDGTIRLWDANERAEKRRWQAGAMSIGAVAFSPDGKTLAASTSWDGSIRLWDVATGKEKQPSAAHRGLVDFLRFSADGTTLLSIGRDRCLLRWDLSTYTPAQLFSWFSNRPSGFALSPGGDTLAVGGWPDSHLRLWDVHTGKPGRALGKPRQEEHFFWTIAFSPDGRLAASQDDDCLIHVWDVRDGKEIRQIKGFTKEEGPLRFSPDSKALSCGMLWKNNVTGERTLRLWDLSSGKERCSFDSRAGGVEAIAFSTDGRMLASGEYSPEQRQQSMVHIWDATTGAELVRHTGHGDRVSAIAFSPDGKLVASGTGCTGWSDNSVHVWEAATGRLIRRFEGHHSCVSSVAFAPDSLTVASGAGDSTILLWDITGRRPDGRWHKKPLTPRQLEACWTALANEDAAKAYDAVWGLVAAPDQAVPLLLKHLPPVKRPDAKKVARLIADLDSDNFLTRQKATEELSKLGDAIAPDLRRALDGKPSLEVRRRIQQLLDQSRDWTPQRLRDHRTIQALEHIGTRQAKEVLQTLAAGAPGTLRTEEANDALRRWKR